MPRTFRHSLLVALMLGFVPASVLNTLAVPLPPSPAAPQAAAAQDSLYKRLGGYDALAAVTVTTSSAAWPLTPRSAASLWA